MNQEALLSETLRPQVLADLNLSENLVCQFQNMVRRKSIMNMIFYGDPGIGKTSAARILLKELGAEVFELNGSFNNGDKGMVKRIESFAYTMSLNDGPKVCFIDEADQMTKEVQNSLRYIIEKVSATTRFLLTANDINKLTPAMKSRCIPLRFDVPPNQIREVIDRMADRYEVQLNKLGYIAEQKRVREIVAYYFPDLRTIANVFQKELSQKEVLSTLGVEYV